MSVFMQSRPTSFQQDVFHTSWDMLVIPQHVCRLKMFHFLQDVIRHLEADARIGEVQETLLAKLKRDPATDEDTLIGLIQVAFHWMSSFHSIVYTYVTKLKNSRLDQRLRQGLACVNCFPYPRQCFNIKISIFWYKRSTKFTRAISCQKCPLLNNLIDHEVWQLIQTWKGMIMCYIFQLRFNHFAATSAVPFLSDLLLTTQKVEPQSCHALHPENITCQVLKQYSKRSSWETFDLVCSGSGQAVIAICTKFGSAFAFREMQILGSPFENLWS